MTIFGEIFSELTSDMEFYVKNIIEELDYTNYQGPKDSIDKLPNEKSRQIFEKVFSIEHNLSQLISLISKDLYVKENYNTLLDITEFARLDAKYCKQKLE